MAKPPDFLRRLIGQPIPTPRALDGLTPDHPPRPHPPIHRWRDGVWLRALVFALVAVATVVLVTSVWFAIALSVNLTNSANAWLELAAAVVGYAILVLVMEARRPPLELAPGRVIGLVKGLLLGLILVAVCVGLLALFGVYRATGWNGAYNPWPDILSLGLVAGVAEEIFFRGLLLRLVEEYVGSWGAVGVSALVFGLLHLTNPEGTIWGGIAIAIEAGLLFGAIYLLTRSLWWCIGLHIAWNIAEGPIFGSIVSGAGAQQSWIMANWRGPTILTGGAFGLEASIVPVILLGGLGLALLVYAQRHGALVAPAWVRRA